MVDEYFYVYDTVCIIIMAMGERNLSQNSGLVKNNYIQIIFHAVNLFSKIEF